jgi:hypothetical protein
VCAATPRQPPPPPSASGRREAAAAQAATPGSRVTSVAVELAGMAVMSVTSAGVQEAELERGLACLAGEEETAISELGEVALVVSNPCFYPRVARRCRRRWTPRRAPDTSWRWRRL